MACDSVILYFALFVRRGVCKTIMASMNIFKKKETAKAGQSLSERRARRAKESHAPARPISIEIEDAQKRRKKKRIEKIGEEKFYGRREPKQKKERVPLSPKAKLIAISVVALAIFLFAIGGYKNIELMGEKREAEKLYEEKLAEKNRLEKTLAQIDEPEYIEQEARDRFHMLKDGETLYILPEESADTSQ